MLRPREAVKSLPSYHPPLEGRQGLRFDFNENTAGCSPRVVERLRGLNAEDLSKYPERGPVEAKLAQFLELAPEEVLLTNGVDEAIHLMCESYLETGDEALILEPTYSMYKIYAMAAGASVLSAPVGDGFRFSIENVKRLLSERTRLIAVANPNNPTGTVVSREDLLEIALCAANAAVLVDEAYFEFYGETLLRTWRDVPNIFVARTFSKAYGLAGLRVGVLAGDKVQMRSLRRACSPYNVNGVALACLPDAIAERDFVAAYVKQVLEGKKRLERELTSLGVEFWPSYANFVLFRASGSAAGAADFVERMRQRGILVRDRSRDPGCEGCVRVTIGPEDHVDKLLPALRGVLDELGAEKPGALRR